MSVLLSVLGVTLIFQIRTPPSFAAELALVAEVPAPGAVVVAGGLHYIELVEAAPEPIRSRLVFLATPPGEVSSDPTNENATRRLASLDSRFRVVPSAQFVARHPCFYLLRPLVAGAGGALARQGLVGPEIARTGQSELRVAGTAAASCRGESHPFPGQTDRRSAGPASAPFGPP